MLNKYLGQFDDCFSRSEPAENLHVYVGGQLSDLPRKSIEPMASRAGVPPRTLQQFLSLADWDDQRMAQRHIQIIADEHSHPMSIGVLDETGHPKKGDKTPGVKRQYCGASGKVDNCVVTVHISYVAGDFHTLLPGELFLPEDWSDDRERCRAAGIPDEMVHRPKWQIGLELRDQAVANAVRFEWFTADEGYGEVPAFHFALDDRGQRFVLEVPSIFHGWLRRPEVLQKQHHSSRKKGRKRRYPRLKAKSLPTIEVRNMLRYCEEFRKQDWVRFHVKDTTKGPEVWQAKTARLYLKRDGLPTRPYWLIVARNALNPEQIKYFVSNAPAGMPLEVMLHVAFTRYRVEQCFEVEKGELGLDHFEVRNYRSLKRHLVLTAVSHLFLAKVHEKWRGEKSRPDDLPGSPGRRGLGAVPVADRPGSNEFPGDRSADHYEDPTGQQEIRTQPREETQAAVA
jgi:SRSO17 transposase